MLLNMHVFGDVSGGYEHALRASYDDFTAWCRSNEINTSQKRWSYRSLFREGYGLYLNCKGFNARVMTEWLLNKLVLVNGEQDRSHLVEDERAQFCEMTLTLNSTKVFG